MQTFHGELLIGGVRLRDLRGALNQEEPAANSHVWLLGGQLHVSRQAAAQLEVGRRYLLMLDDGREGLIELTELTNGDDELRANFRPRPPKPR